MRIGSKLPRFAPDDVIGELDRVPKSRLIDVIWNFALLLDGEDRPEGAKAKITHELAVIEPAYKEARHDRA